MKIEKYGARRMGTAGASRAKGNISFIVKVKKFSRRETEDEEAEREPNERASSHFIALDENTWHHSTRLVLVDHNFSYLSHSCALPHSSIRIHKLSKNISIK